MDNPFKTLRKLTGLSQKEFGAKYGFSRTALTYIENGQYPDLSDNMIACIQSELLEKGLSMTEVLQDKYGTEELQEAYHTWQSNQRMLVSHLFRTPPTKEEGKHSPFYHFEVQIAGNPTNFCRMLKVPAATAMRYAMGHTKQMPQVILAALQEVQYPYILDLNTLMDEWNSD